MHRLFLIRHGEPLSAWGQGIDDPGLSDLGKRQAAAAATVLRQKGDLGAITSPMLRCRETAAPFSATPSVEPRVSEVQAPTGVERRGWLAAQFPWQAGIRRRLWADLDPQLWRWREEVLHAVLSLKSDCAIFSHFIAINAIVGAALRSNETIVCTPDHASVTELRVSNGQLELISMGAQTQHGEVR